MFDDANLFIVGNIFAVLLFCWKKLSGILHKCCCNCPLPRQVNWLFLLLFDT